MASTLALTTAGGLHRRGVVVSGTRVVIAEDDSDIAALLRDGIAEAHGVASEVVGNGALVMDVVARLAPDILILDVRLPGLSGVDVFELVTWEHTKMRVLFLTGAPERVSGLRGSPEVIPKPFDLDWVLWRIGELLAESAAA